MFKKCWCDASCRCNSNTPHTDPPLQNQLPSLISACAQFPLAAKLEALQGPCVIPCICKTWSPRACLIAFKKHLCCRQIFLILPSSGSLIELNKFQVIFPILYNEYNLKFCHIFFSFSCLSCSLKAALIGANSYYYKVL